MIIIDGTTLQVAEDSILEVGSTDIQIVTDTTDVPIVSELVQGPEGASAYAIALKNGFVGTEQEWLSSINEDAKQYALDNLNAQKGASDGVVPLDESQLISVDYLPTEVALKTDIPNLVVKEEGTQIVAQAKSLNFVGTSVKATNSSGDVTVTVDTVNVVNCNISMNSVIVSGQNLTVNVSGSAGLQGQSIASFVVTNWNGTDYSVTASGNTGVKVLVPVGSIGTSFTVKAYSIDTAGNKSAVVSANVTIVANSVPTGTITVNAPTQVATTTSGNQISFTGLTDSDGTPFTYTIVQTGQAYPLTFSKTSGIAQGEVIAFTAPDVTASGADQTTTFSVYAVDSLGLQTSSVSFSVTILASTVVGVVLKATGGAGGTWAQVDVNGNDITALATSWFDVYGPYKFTAVTVSGKSMIKVPKFYYKVGTISGGANNGKTAWWVSDLPRAGFTLHPAFMNAGSVVNQFYIAVNETAGYPGYSLNTAKSEAASFNTGGATGFQILNFWMLSAIQMLYLIEKRTMANTSGSAVVSTNYRGINGVAGALNGGSLFLTWLDGIQNVSGVWQTFDTNGNQTWVNTGVSVVPYFTPYPITFSQDPKVSAGFLSTTGASSQANGTSPDLQSLTATYIMQAGASSSAGTGLWSLAGISSPTTQDSTYGYRLCKY